MTHVRQRIFAIKQPKSVEKFSKSEKRFYFKQLPAGGWNASTNFENTWVSQRHRPVLHVGALEPFRSLECHWSTKHEAPMNETPMNQTPEIQASCWPPWWWGRKLVVCYLSTSRLKHCIIRFPPIMDSWKMTTILQMKLIFLGPGKPLPWLWLYGRKWTKNPNLDANFSFHDPENSPLRSIAFQLKFGGTHFWTEPFFWGRKSMFSKIHPDWKDGELR